MYCLEVIKASNARIVRQAAAPALHARDCSFHETRQGLILHSAIHRNTLFVPRDSECFAVLSPFLAKASRKRRNRAIEAYFSDETESAAEAVSVAKA